jgi:stage II sporulation protein AA (anti-sigma F factor antagonist)
MKKVEFVKENNSLVIYFYGEVDNKACKDYKSSIIDTINNFSYLDVIFDFSNVTFIDSSGIGLIIGRYNQLKEKGNSLSIRGTNKSIDKLFSVSGLWNILNTSSRKKVSV